MNANPANPCTIRPTTLTTAVVAALALAALAACTTTECPPGTMVVPGESVCSRVEVDAGTVDAGPVEFSCDSDEDCSSNASQPFCRPDGAACTACLVDADCADSARGPFCNRDQSGCVECLRSDDCGEGMGCTENLLCRRAEGPYEMCRRCRIDEDCAEGLLCVDTYFGSPRVMAERTSCLLPVPSNGVCPNGYQDQSEPRPSTGAQPAAPQPFCIPDEETVSCRAVDVMGTGCTPGAASSCGDHFGSLCADDESFTVSPPNTHACTVGCTTDLDCPDDYQSSCSAGGYCVAP